MTGGWTGGFLGYNNGNLIKNSYSTCDLSGGGVYVGGFVGANWATPVSNCYSTGDVTHFGPFYGQRLQGVLVVAPGNYLRSRIKGEPAVDSGG